MHRFVMLALCTMLWQPGGAALRGDDATIAPPRKTGRLPAGVPRNLAGKSSRPLKCFVHWQGTPLRTRPAADAAIVSTARFLDPYYIAAEDASGRYWLLAEAGDELLDPALTIKKHHGWIPKQHCLSFTGLGPESLRHTQTLVYRKAMLINRFDQGDGLAALRQPVAFLGRPNHEAKQLAQHALFEIYYVFDETDDYLFLGREPRADQPGRLAEVLLGWVPKSRACPWNTREAVEFNKRDLADRTKTCRIFASRRELQDDLDLRQVPHIAEEDMNVKSWRYYQPRFPLVSDEHERYQGTSFLGTRIFKVGVIGDVWTTDAGVARGGTPRVIAKATTIDRLKEKVVTLKDRASTIQVCFVIDATFSMKPWFKTAASAVTRIVSGIQDRVGTFEIQPKVEISVNFYRDKDDGRLAFEANPFAGSATAVTLLEKQQALGGGRPYELLNYGIIQALQRNPFQNEAVKVLIVIGDDGNHPDDKQYNIDRVFKALVDAGGASPVGFFAFAVGPDEENNALGVDPGNLRASGRRAFVLQTQEIARRLRDHQHKMLRENGTEALSEQTKRAVQQLTGDVLVTSDPAMVVTAIDNRFQLAEAQMLAMRKYLVDLQDGNILAEDVPLREVIGDARLQDADLNSFGVVWRGQMLELVRREGLEPLQLARSGVQLFYEGWVAEYDPRETAPPGGERPRQIRHVALMHKSELRKLSVVLETALARWDVERLDTTWKRGLDTITDGKTVLDPNATPAELFLKHLGGVKVKDGILALSFDELSRQPASELVKLRDRLRLKSQQLSDVLDEKQARYATSPRLRRIDQGERKYWWGDDLGSDRRAWVDREYLP